MDTLILIATVLLCAGQSIANALYGKKKANSAFLFSAMTALVSMLFFIGYNGFRFVWDPYTLWMSFWFSIAWIVCNIASLYAVRFGSVALTSMISSFSLLLPTLFGIIYWKEGVKPAFLVGLALLCGSIVLTNLQGEKSSEKQKKRRLLWVFCVTLLFFSNGCCSILQTFHQKTGEEAFKSEFMIVALFLVFVSNILVAVFSLKKTFPDYAKKAAPYATAYGLMNAGVNLGVMLLASGGAIPSSVFFPVISIGSLVLVFGVSMLFFKERFRRIQYIGILLGIVSIVLLQM